MILKGRISITYFYIHVYVAFVSIKRRLNDLKRLNDKAYHILMSDIV